MPKLNDTYAIEREARHQERLRLAPYLRLTSYCCSMLQGGPINPIIEQHCVCGLDHVMHPQEDPAHVFELSPEQARRILKPEAPEHLPTTLYTTTSPDLSNPIHAVRTEAPVSCVVDRVWKIMCRKGPSNVSHDDLLSVAKGGDPEIF